MADGEAMKPLVGEVLPPLANSLTVQDSPFTPASVRMMVPLETTLEEMVVLSGVPTEYFANLQVYIADVEISPNVWHLVRPKPGREVFIRVNLRGGGEGGSKNVLRAVAMIAVVVLATAVAGPAGTALSASFFGGSAIAATIATALIGAAISTVGTFLVNALIPPPSSRGQYGFDQELGNPYGQITGLRNQMAPYSAIPRVFGRRRMFPMLAGRPYTETVGNDQYLVLLLLVGQGPLKISEIKLGETPIANIQGLQIETREGWPEDAPVTLYQKSIREDQQSIVLDVNGVTATRTTRPDTTEISVEVSFPSGINRVDKGELRFHEATFSVQYRATGTSGAWLNADWTEKDSAYGTGSAGTLFCRDRTQNGIRKSGRWSVPKGQYDVRITRNGTNPIIGEVSYAIWTTLRSIVDQPFLPVPGMSLIAMRIKASGQLNGVPDQINCVAESYLPVWNGTSWAYQITRNPAWAYADVLRRRGYATLTPDYRLDLPTIKAWADANDAAPPNGPAPYWTFDAVMEGGSIFTGLRTAASHGRASFAIKDGRYSVVRDVPQTIPVQHISPRNSWGYTGSKIFTDIPDALRVRFPNEDKQFAEDEVIVYAPGFSAEGGGGTIAAATFETLDMPGCSRAQQAWREGMYHFGALILRPETHVVNMDVENLRCGLGDFVRFSHDVIKIGLSWGRIKSVVTAAGQVTQLVLDGEVSMATGTTYGVRCRRADFNSVVMTLAAFNGVTNVVTLVTPLPIANAPAAGDLFQFGESGLESAPMIVKRIAPGGDLTAAITLVDAQEGVWTADQGIIPPFQTFITDPRPLDRIQPAAPLFDLRSDSNTARYLNDSTVIERIGVGFRALPSSEVPIDSIEIQYRDTDSPEFLAHSRVPRDTSGVFIDPVYANNDYEVRARSITREGLTSDWYSRTITVQGKTITPLPPTFLTATGGVTAEVGKINLSFGLPDEPDLWFTEIFVSETNNRADAVSLANVPDPGETFSHDVLGVIERYYWARTVDLSGNLSSNGPAYIPGDQHPDFYRWTPASPAGGVLGTSRAMVAGDIDTTPPGVPTGLNLVSPPPTLLADGTYVVKVVATWTPPTASDLAGYDIELVEDGGTPYVQSVPEARAEFFAKTGSVYSARVRAYDRTGNRSAYSAADSVVGSADTTPPGIPTGLTALPSPNVIFLSWTNPSDADVASAIVYENAVNDSSAAVALTPVGSGPGQKVSWARGGLDTGQTRFYWIKARDRTGNLSGFSDVATTTTTAVGIDTTPPAVPTGFLLTSAVATAVPGDPRVRVIATWSGVGDADLDGYEVELTENGGAPLIFPTSATSAEWIGRSGSAYVGRVRARDRSGNRSAFTATSSVTGATDTVPPSAPSALAYDASLGSVFLKWTNPADGDLAKVDIYESTTNDSGAAGRIATVNASPAAPGGYARSGLPSGATRYYFLKAIDTSGNASVFSAGLETVVASITPADVDTTPPAVPTGLSLTSSVSFDAAGNPVVTVTATWAANGDADLSVYELEIVENGGAPVVRTNGGPRDQFRALSGASYVGRVRAVDKSGNRSAYTATQSVTGAADSVAPSAPTGLTNSTSLSAVYLAWSNPSDSDLKSIEVYENTIDNPFTSSLMGTATARPSTTGGWSKTGLPSGAIRYYYLRAVDSSGNRSDYSAGTYAVVGKVQVTDFASTIAPVELFANDTAAGFPAVGRTYFNTTDFQLRRGNGAQWVSSVPAVEVTGQLTDAQIASIAAAKVAGQLTNAQLADIAATKVTGQIVSTQITDNAITTAKIMAGAVVTASLAAGAVVADTIAANAITTAKIEAGAVVAASIAAGAIIAEKIAAQAITAEKLVIGQRSLQVAGLNFSANPTTDTVSWTPGTVIGSGISIDITTGGSYTWTGGYAYVYATMGLNSLAVTTNRDALFDATQIIVATYAGGPFVATPSATIIDGTGIRTGSITAGQIMANTITAGLIAAGAITATEISAGAITTEKLGAQVVTAAKIAAGTITADEIAANTITGVKMLSTTSLPGTITVGLTGVQLGVVEGRAANPIPQINLQSTQIDPGRILIKGAVSLRDWQQGGDSTEIAGGQIAANTIRANSIAVGLRGVQTVGFNFTADPATNVVSWSAGDVVYTNDSGGASQISASANNAVWTSGRLYLYVQRGLSGVYATTNRDAIDEAEQIILATYAGGTALDANYGRTIIDGTGIRTGSITAGQIMANTITATQIASSAITTEKLAALAITAEKIAANAITADKIVANTITGDRISTTTSLPGTITVGLTGVEIGTVESRAANPIPRINAQSTTIDPGRIRISGATLLTNWIQGGDTTEIAGGMIAANTIRANSIVLGNRNAQAVGFNFTANPATNVVSWSAGDLIYTNDAGGSSQISTGAGSYTWTGGYIYLYMQQGISGVYATDNRGALNPAIQIILATYAGGTLLLANYGQTIIDGTGIRTGSITAGQIAANTITATQIAGQTITATQIAAGTITALNIASNAITTEKLAANAVTAEKITVTDLAAIKAVLGVVTTGLLQNAGLTFAVNATLGVMVNFTGSYMKVIGSNFGASSNLDEWYGPKPTGATLTDPKLSTLTTTNGAWAMAGGTIYYGTAPLDPGGGGGDLTVTNELGQTIAGTGYGAIFGSGWQTLFSATLNNVAVGQLISADIDFGSVSTDGGTNFVGEIRLREGSTVIVGPDAITLFPSAPNDPVIFQTVASASGTVSYVIEARQTSGSGLNSGSGQYSIARFATATPSTSGLLSAADKAKLDSLSPGGGGGGVVSGSNTPFAVGDGTTVGQVRMIAGTSSTTGYIDVLSAGGTRRGFIGNASGGKIRIDADSGYSYGFNVRPDFAGQTPYDTGNLNPVSLVARSSHTGTQDVTTISGLANSATITASASATDNTIVIRTGDGYLRARQGFVFEGGTDNFLFASSTNMTFNANCYAFSFTAVSDRNAKEDIRPFKQTAIDRSALDIVRNIDLKRFKWKKSQEQTFGLIAQELEPLAPELINRSPLTGMMGIEYGPLAALAMQATKEVDASVVLLEAKLLAKIAALEAKLLAVTK